MRLGLVVYGDLGQLSGGYLYDRKLVEYLRRCGDQVEVVSLPRRNYAAHLTDNFSREVRSRLRALDADLLLQDELNHPSLFLQNRWLRAIGPEPIVAIVHHLRSSERHPAWQNWLYRIVERLYLRSVDAFVYNSQATRHAVTRLLAGDRPGVVAYPAGDRLSPQLTAADIQSRAEQPGPLRVLFLGNVIPRKGLHVLVAALHSLPPESWVLTVVGSLEAAPGYVSAVRRRLQQSGMAGQVTFTDSLDTGPLKDWMVRHHTLVVPSFFEGFGIAYLEGMGFGLPAIASCSGGPPELIAHEENGFLIPPGDAEALARAIRSLQSDRGRLARMGIAARARFEAHPTWDQTGKQIRSFLHNVSTSDP